MLTTFHKDHVDISPFLPTVERKKSRFKGAHSYQLLKEIPTVNTLQEMLQKPIVFPYDLGGCNRKVDCISFFQPFLSQ